MIILFIETASASMEEIGFNVSSEFEHTDGAGLQFLDEDVSRIRIFDGWDIDKYSKGFTKYNETVYIFNKSSEMGKSVIYQFALGEYIIIDGKKYWVEVNSEDIENPNYEKCLEYLDYFNEHNNFELVKVE